MSDPRTQTDRLDELEANDRNRRGDRSAIAFLRPHDKGTTARERGYSHGELPGGPTVHLDRLHLENVAGPSVGIPGDLTADERDEELRAEADRAHDGDTMARVAPRPIDPRSWMAGWDAAAQALYFASSRHSGVWNDQAWKRATRRLPPPRSCVVCGDLFQPQRSTARYCTEACKQRAKRRRVATR
jgi:hypothetical protein